MPAPGRTLLRVVAVGASAVAAWALFGAVAPPSPDHLRPAAGRDAWSPAPATTPPGLRTLRVPDPLAPTHTRMALVWRPDVPDSRSVPVVYFLHGLPGAAADWTRAGAIPVLASVQREGDQPFVAVFPDGSTNDNLDTEWGDDAHSRVDLESFVTGPLIHAVEGANVRDRQHRAIAGFSMGGFAAAAIALRHPDLYGQAVALAGYFHIDDPDHIFNDPSQHDPSKLLSPACRVRWLLADGNDDSLPVVQGETQRFARLLRTQHISVEERITPGAHSVAWAVAQLPMVARFFDEGWKTAS